VKSKWEESIFLGSLVKKGLQKENSISESSGGAAGGGGGGRRTIFVVTKKGCVVGDFWSFVRLFFFFAVPSFFSTIPIKYIRKLRSRLSPGFNG